MKKIGHIELPKEKHALLMEVMKNSQQFCSIVFDKNRIFVDAKPDVPMEISND